MGFYYDQPYTFSSPVAVLHALHPSQPYKMNPISDPFGNSSPYGRAAPEPASWVQPRSETPLSAGSRKRSRDEAADNLEDDHFTPATASVPESEEDWEYGEGMTLIKPNGFIIDASSQTGTWAEEKAEASQTQAQTPPAIPDRPTLRSYKSQRLDLTATPIITEEICSINGRGIVSNPPTTSIIGAEEPTIDAFTIHLGIGWSRISHDEDIQAAARGWARFVENHYPVSGVHIRLQSKGLASYLVESREGWFLFGEDLKEGRLVAGSLGRTIENLKTQPPVFDGENVLVAAVDTPRIEVEARREIAMDDAVAMYASPLESVTNGISEPLTAVENGNINGFNSFHLPTGQLTEQDLGMDMDMS